MAFNPFIGRNKEWLLQKLAEAQDELAGGMSTISGGLGEANFGKIMTVGPAERIQLIMRALNLIDPVGFPIDATSAPRRTVATFRGAL